MPAALEARMVRLCAIEVKASAATESKVPALRFSATVDAWSAYWRAACRAWSWIDAISVVRPSKIRRPVRRYRQPGAVSHRSPFFENNGRGPWQGWRLGKERQLQAGRICLCRRSLRN